MIKKLLCKWFKLKPDDGREPLLTSAIGHLQWLQTVHVVGYAGGLTLPFDPPIHLPADAQFTITVKRK